MKNIIDAAAQAGNFRTLLSAFKAASLIDMLRSPGQYTIFAPTDAAFKRLPAGSLDALFKDARTLKPFLCNHMMRGAKAANDILPGELTPLEGKTLRASLRGQQGDHQRRADRAVGYPRDQRRHSRHRRRAATAQPDPGGGRLISLRSRSRGIAFFPRPRYSTYLSVAR